MLAVQYCDLIGFCWILQSACFLKELRQEEGCFVIVVPPRADGLSRLLGLHPTCARLVVWSILPAGGNHTSGGSLTAWLLALLLRSRRSEHLRVALEGLERSCALA